MSTHDLQWNDAIDEAAWIEPQLAPFGSGLVTSIIPSGFPAYARLPHPVTAGAMGEHIVRWSDVAAWSGLPLRRLSDFHDVALPEHLPAEPAPWDSQGPTQGTLCDSDAAALVEVLDEHTPVVDGVRRCWFGLWEGYGWNNAVYLLSIDAPAQLRADPPRPPDPIPARAREGKRVRLPNRDYLLYTGAVSVALAFVPEQHQSPNLWWAADRSWCVASEIDLPWTYVGGSQELINQILSHPDLEALPASPHDDYTIQAPGWLQDKVAAAVEELLSAGEATVDTSVGTARVGLRAPTRLRDGRLRIDCQRTLPGGASSSGSDIPLSRADPDGLARTIQSYLLRAILGMVNS